MVALVIPSWDSIHPLVVHFPIALLLIAPVLVIAGIMLWRRGVGLRWSALLLMVLGTAGAGLAVSSGEAAAELAERNAASSQILEAHEELAETVLAVFSGLTFVYALLLIVPLLVKMFNSRKLLTSLHVCFLVGYLGASVLLVRAAHEGGRLVHEYGIHAMMTPPAAPPAAKHTRAEEH